jgi:hypothetical protein
LKSDDLSSPDVVFQIGVSPSSIDLLTSITAVSFEGAWHNRIRVRVADRNVPTIGKEDLLRNKRAVGRPRDLADVADIEAQPEREQ